MSFEQRYKNLNTQQKQAVDQIDGPVMVIAGPGSGKTELLSIRVANILKKSDTLPESILCLTFTDAASKNMRDRLFKLIGLDAHKVNIHTFHSFARDIVYRFKDDFYDAIQMETADEMVQMDVITSILEKFPLSSAFSRKNKEGFFMYLSAIKDRIGKLKKAGITPDEYKKILQFNELTYKKIENVLVPVFDVRISKKMIPEIDNVLANLRILSTPNAVLDYSNLINYKELLVKSLESAYNESVEEDSTKPITKWKNEWLGKDSYSKELKLKDERQIKVNFALVEVYEKYQKKMKHNSYVDFDDIILDLISVLESRGGILASLQEQFQYVLVDEFQDTNESQMRIINLLIDNPIHEGKPNIMVVGDDDQTIYKFQGAELNNILQFKNKYPETKLITLVKNYRSTKAIVEFSQRIILQGEERLENQIDEVRKDLESANPNILNGVIFSHTFDTISHEYEYVAQEIKGKIDKNVNADTIAIIARKHSQLEIIAKYLQNSGVPVRYEKQRNVLEDSHIQQLILMAQLIQSISDKRLKYENSLMPKFLAFPFWNVEAKVIWQLSLDANKERKSNGQGRWLDIMFKSDNAQLKNIANWLIDTAGKTSVSSLESIMDVLLGPPECSEEKFTSSFRQYYFNRQNYKNNLQKYLEQLSSFNVFLQVIYNYDKNSSKSCLKNLIKCVKLYTDHNLPITDNTPYISASKAVTLLTAHKAKGLEFETVFVINCQKKVWNPSKRGNSISFPKNIAIDPGIDVFDDHLRLFFVALTRAKSYLYLTAYTTEDNGKMSVLSPFLTEDIFDNFNYELQTGHKNSNVENTINALESKLFPIISINVDEKNVLQPLVENYMLNVTHLNNFLNVVDNGPYIFLEKNLLFFPEAKNSQMKYGSAMHATIEDIYHYVKTKNTIPAIKNVQVFFRDRMEKMDFDKSDLEQYLEKGSEVWDVYMKEQVGNIDSNHRIETNFRMQQAVIGDIHLSGKIDKMVLNEDGKIIDVYDFKTGKYKLNWKQGDEIQLYSYKRQLIFYKILVENSRDFSNYKVNTGHLEFLYPTEKKDIFTLDYDISDDDVERLKKIIIAVGKKIKNLDFPDINKYEKNLNGVIKFEDDLISGSI